MGSDSKTLGRRPGTHRASRLRSRLSEAQTLGRWDGIALPLQRLTERPFRTLPDGILLKFLRRLSQFPLSFLGACPTLTFLLRRTIRCHLRRSRSEKILNVFQRIRLRFSQACGLASSRTSFASSRRQCRTGSVKVSMGTPFLRRIGLQGMPPLPVSLQIIKNRKATGRLQACRSNASPRSVGYSDSDYPRPT